MQPILKEPVLHEDVTNITTAMQNEAKFSIWNHTFQKV